MERFEVGLDTHGLVGFLLLVGDDRETDSRLFGLSCERLFEYLLKEGVLQGVVLLHDVYRAASAGAGVEVEREEVRHELLGGHLAEEPLYDVERTVEFSEQPHGLERSLLVLGRTFGLGLRRVGIDAEEWKPA